jgi:adenylosuccinate lyase
MKIIIQIDDTNIHTDVRRQLAVIIERLRHMATQDQVDALAAQITTITDALATAVADIRQDIADLKAANPGVDLTNLEANVATLSAAVDTATELDAENPPII